VTIWGQSAGTVTLTLIFTGKSQSSFGNLLLGAGSAIQHLVANGGKTSPKLFRAVITSSTFMPSQYHYDSSIPQVGALDPSLIWADFFSRPYSTKLRAEQGMRSSESWISVG
jgi:hypothetical protein